MDIRQDERLVPTSPDGADTVAALSGTDDEAPGPADEFASAAGQRSLADDLEALLADLRLYFDAELAFQKTRAAFMADSLKRTIVFATVGAFFAMLATIGLAIGAIIALTPLIGPWAATAVVVAILLVAGGLFLWKASASWRGMMDAVRDNHTAGDASHG